MSDRKQQQTPDPSDRRLRAVPDLPAAISVDSPTLQELHAADIAAQVAALTPEDLERGEQIMADVMEQVRQRHAAEAAGVVSIGKEKLLRRRRKNQRNT